MSGVKKSSTFMSISKTMAYVLLVYPLFLAALQEFLRLPGIVKYVADMAWITIALLFLLRSKVHIRRVLVPFAIVVGIFALYTFIVYLFRYQSILYYLWGCRNYFRFFVAFFAFSVLFSERDGLWGLEFLDKLFYINALLCLIQFIMGKHQDNIGGIFGTATGCNGYLIIYLSITVCKTLLGYMDGTEAALPSLAKCIIALVISALAELKFFFIVFVVILAISALLTSFSIKKVLVLLVGTLLISIGAAILGTIYTYFDGFFSFDSLLASLLQDNYASSEDMGRTSAIPFISRRFLKTVPDQLFGLGLGNCDTSSIAIFNTSFSDRYEDLHYSIFSYAMMFLENGYIGLILYVLFFLLCFINARKQLKRESGNRLLCQVAIVMSVICFILLIYNSSLRTEAGYMIFFTLALPYMQRTGEINGGVKIQGRRKIKFRL